MSVRVLADEGEGVVLKGMLAEKKKQEATGACSCMPPASREPLAKAEMTYASLNELT